MSDGNPAATPAPTNQPGAEPGTTEGPTPAPSHLENPTPNPLDPGDPGKPATPPETPAAGGEPEPSDPADTGAPDPSSNDEADDGKPAVDPDPTKSDDEGGTISSVRELIDTQEWDPEWFDSLSVPVKVNGKPAETTIGELVASFQMTEAADQRLEEAKVKAKSQSEQMAQRTQDLEGQFAVAAKLVENAEALLDTETAGIDWDDLRENDKASYAAKKSDLAERRQEIDAIKTQTVDAYTKAVEQRHQQIVEDFTTRRDEQSKLLLDNLPAWRDEKVRDTEQAQLRTYLLTQGFSEDDVLGASDHRLIVLANKARLYDDGQKKVDTAKKRVRKKPKVLKPGGAPDQPQPKQPTTRAGILYPSAATG